MMERKFTDDEIVKALECCKNAECLSCPRWTEGWCDGMCNEFLQDVIDLINRQKAEIERLEEAYAIYEETTGLKWVRAEAIKEFAERVKDIVDEPALIRGRVIDVTIAKIDNLVKEMTEESTE